MRRLRNRYFLATDLLLLPLAVYASFVLRLDSFRLAGWWVTTLLLALAVVLVAPPLFFVAGLYTRYWQDASVEELPRLLGSVGLLSLTLGGVVGAGVLWPGDAPRIPRSVPIIFFMLALAAVAGPRLAVRLLSALMTPACSLPAPTPTLIVGAGAAGTMVARELQRNPQLGLHVVGFVDDDPAKQQLQVRGVAVRGTREALPELIRQHRVQRVIIAMPTAPGATVREIVGICRGAGIAPQIVPGLYELLGGAVRVSQLRNVEIEDLLRREPVVTDLAAVGRLVGGKCVLVTGAGGSIGSELCRQLLRFRPRQLVLLGHGENSIFTVHNELLGMLPSLPPDGEDTAEPLIQAVIADVRSATRLQAIFDRFQPEVVFHAAAHKHVPLMELNPTEAITNNVLGTRNVINASLRVGVERFVLVSTDKAVNPTSVMGASKRIAELLTHRAAQLSGRGYMVVRFGNVLGSRGSVVLTMKRQIANGGPVTVTHPEMVRYFMTIPEAVQLVLQAAVLGRGGEVFMFDMGEPVRIVDLASDLIRLSGLEVGEDIEIVYTGVRPGEKLFEELFLPQETYQRTDHAKIFIAVNASNAGVEHLDQQINRLAEAARRRREDDVRALLREVMPEYQPTDPWSRFDRPALTPGPPAPPVAEPARELRPAAIAVAAGD